MWKLNLVMSLAVFFAGVPAVHAENSVVYWSGVYTCSGTTGCVKTSTGSSTCMLFPAGNNDVDSFTRITQGSDDSFVACWALDTSVSIVPASLSITDPGQSGPGSCEIVEATTAENESIARVDTRGLYPELRYSNGGNAPAYKSGICSTAIWSGKDLLFPPCDSTSDCTSLSAGTCSTTTGNPLTADQLRRAGAYLICESVGGGSETMIVQKRRVLR